MPADTQITIPHHYLKAVKVAREEDEDAGHRHVGREDDDVGWVTVSICYHVCLEDPTPVLAGDCHDSPLCEAGTVREGFSLVFSEGKPEDYHYECHIENLLSSWRVRYQSIIEWMSEDCPDPPPAEDACIPLASVYIGDEKGGHACDRTHVHVQVRPFVPTNLLLFELFEDLMRDKRKSGRRSK